MKILQLIFSLLIIVNFMETSWADDNIDMVAMKRPFCNAFTGCGRKRDPAYAQAVVGPQSQQLQQLQQLQQWQQLLPSDNGGVYQVLRVLAAKALRNEEARMRQRPSSGGPLGPLDQPHLVLF